jgi:hypothetical protein
LSKIEHPPGWKVASNFRMMEEISLSDEGAGEISLFAPEGLAGLF